ncbi:MAG: hypothetical protein JWL65_7737 [Gammaproteobacteria bacterium]|nr:hypothetical protein [Gammaproteobacteria bacterium]
MPSYVHQLLLLLFRNRSGSAADLLRELDVQLPGYDEVRIESADLSDLRPAEYQADLVLFLLRGRHKVLGVIVEVQLRRDEDKPYTWPAYVANLRARHRCPVCLLVITIEEAVARWARKSIELGPGSRCSPWVVGPSNTPAVTERRDAEENVELSILSAIEHGQSADIALATRIAAAAVLASAGLDAERSRLYLDLILVSLSKNVRHEVLQVMNSLGFEYQGDSAPHFVAKGRAEARVEIIVMQLTLRFGPVTEEVQSSLRSAPDAQLDAVLERVISAQTLEEALGPLS